ncbi:MAG: hypothetical protein RH982_16910 [Parvibaculum sp.]
MRHRPAPALAGIVLALVLLSTSPAHAESDALFRGLPEGSFEVPETPPGGTPRLGRLDPVAAADTSFEAYKERERDAYEDYAPNPLDPREDRDLLESWAGNNDLRGHMRDFFTSTDKRIAEVNRLIGEVEEAARHCDRIEYDAAVGRLIRAYVRASLHIQRNIDQIDSLVEASAGYYDAAKKDAPVFAVDMELRHRWAQFWWGFLDVMASNDYARPAKEVWRRVDTAYRAGILGEAYTRVWSAMLEEIERRLSNADYPPFPKECGEDGEADIAMPAPEEDPELEAQREVLAGMDAEFAAMDEKFRRIAEGFDGAMGDLPPPAEPEQIAALPASEPLPAPEMYADLPQAPMTAPPNMEAVLPDPSTFKVPTTNLPKIDAAAGGPAADMRADPCGLDPVKVCAVLLDEFRGACTRELSGFLAICRKGPSLTDCAARCEGNWQQGKHNLALGDLARAHVRRVADASGTESEKEAERMLAEIEATKERMAGIKAGAAKRVVSIYVNENTDTVIQHHGKPFKPHPPLRFAGTAGGELYLGERVMLADLEARNLFLEKEIDRLIDEAGSGWAAMAASKWQADPSAAGGSCDARQNDANRDACLAACKGTAPAQAVNVCHASFVPQLALPYGRGFLYPPGDLRGPAEPVTAGRVQP